MSVADAFNDRKGWRQGWLGDLAFRLRLFFAPARVVDVLNQVEAAQAGIQAALLPTGAAVTVTPDQLLRDADDQLTEAREALREFVFGRVEPLGDPRYDGPEQCAVVIDSADNDFYIDRSGVVRDTSGRAVPKKTILTYRRNL